jgi:hypothetical protein
MEWSEAVTHGGIVAAGTERKDPVWCTNLVQQDINPNLVAETRKPMDGIIAHYRIHFL